MDAPDPNTGPTPRAGDPKTGGTGVAGQDHMPDARPATTSPPATSTRPHATTAEFDPTSPHPARVHACWLGNHKDSFAADRAAAAQIAAIAPWIVRAARAERAFLTRAVTHLAKTGTDQYVYLAPGMPTPGGGNLHQIVQRINPDARVVYVDSDPIVLAYARALLTGRHAITVPGNIRESSTILADPAVRDHLDLARPITILLVSVLQVVSDDEAAGIVATFRDSLTPGSHLVISHPADLTDGPRKAYAAVSPQVWGLYQELVGSITPGLRRVPGVSDLSVRWRGRGGRGSR